MRRYLPLLAAVLLGAGCSNRERLNPLDPANTVTRGAPQGFIAIAGDGLVTLTWQGVLPGQILGYRLYRRVGSTGAFEVLADLPPKSAQYIDAGLANDIEYGYRIVYVLANGALSAAAADFATPGRARPWVVDYMGRTLSRLAPDGRHAVADPGSSSLQTPSALDVDPLNGQVWVCDPYGGTLWRVTPSFSATPIGSFNQPVAVAIDPGGRRAWVCDQSSGQLQCLDLGNPGPPIFVVPGLATPLSVAVDVIDGSAWVCERTGDAVRHIGFSGTRMGAVVVTEPSRVAVDSLTRRIWVTSFNARRVSIFNGAGFPIDSILNLGGPVGVTVDPRTGLTWVADTGGDRVIAYDRDTRAQRVLVTGLSAPLDVSVDRATGQAWVAVSAGGEVVRIAPDGKILSRTGGFQQPTGISVERRP